MADLKDKTAGKGKEIAGEILGNGNLAEEGKQQRTSGMNRRVSRQVRLKGFANLHETKMPVVVSCQFPFHTSERTQ